MKNIIIHKQLNIYKRHELQGHARIIADQSCRSHASVQYILIKTCAKHDLAWSHLGVSNSQIAFWLTYTINTSDHLEKWISDKKIKLKNKTGILKAMKDWEISINMNASCVINDDNTTITAHISNANEALIPIKKHFEKLAQQIAEEFRDACSSELYYFANGTIVPDALLNIPGE